jgi:hypothetical protein
MLNKNNLKVAQFASKEESRYCLSGIQVRADATIATNGALLVWTSKAPGDSSTFPLIDGAPAPQENHAPFVLGAEQAKAIEKAIPRKPAHEILGNAAVAVDPEGKPTISVTDLESPQIFRPAPLGGKFPEWEYVMPKGKPVFQIGLSAAYLAQIAKFAAEFHAGRDPGAACLRLSFYSEDNKKAVSGWKPVRFDIENADKTQGMTAVLMPMRIDEKESVGHTYGNTPDPIPAEPAKESAAA